MSLNYFQESGKYLRLELQSLANNHTVTTYKTNYFYILHDASSGLIRLSE